MGMLLLVSERSKESIPGGRRIRALAAAASADTTDRVSIVYCWFIIHVHYIDENARIAESAGSNKQDRVAWSRSEATRPSGAILLSRTRPICINDVHLLVSPLINVTCSKTNTVVRRRQMNKTNGTTAFFSAFTGNTNKFWEHMKMVLT